MLTGGGSGKRLLCAAFQPVSVWFLWGAAAVVAAMSSPYPSIQVPSSATATNDSTTTTTLGIMNYVHPSVDIAHVHRATTGDDSPVQATWESVPVPVHEARAACHLDVQGCELLAAPLSSSSSDLSNLDFLDSHQVMDVYYPACEALVRQRLGGSNDNNNNKVSVTAFDHNIRMAVPPSDSNLLKNAGGSTVQSPLGVVHGDYTAVSAPRRLADLAQPPKANDVWRARLPAGASLLNADAVAAALAGRRRYALINVWRSIDPDHPVTSYPLACCNAQTVSRDDLRTLQIHYADRIGENYLATHSARHEWLYFDQMTRDEALLIKQWDSKGNLAAADMKESDKNQQTKKNEIATFAIHSAFAPPPTSGQQKPRQSIEVRCVCLWEEEDDDDVDDDDIDDEHE